MIARIAADGHRGVEVFRFQAPEEPEQFRPIPLPERVLVAIGGPRCIVADEANAGKGRLQEFGGVRLADEGDVVALLRRMEQGRGKAQVAQTPEFEDKELGAGRSGWRVGGQGGWRS